MALSSPIRLSKNFYPTVLAVFIGLLLAFNKGFSFIHFWVGGIPLFITEIIFVLGFFYVLFRFVLAKEKRSPIPLVFWLFLAVFAASGIHAYFVLYQNPESLLFSVKRSALFYYSLFFVIGSVCFQEEKNMRLLLRLVFVAGVFSMAVDVLEKLFGVQWPFAVRVGIANELAKMAAVFYGLFGGDPLIRKKWLPPLLGLMVADLFFTGMRSALVTFMASFVLMSALAGFFGNKEIFQKALKALPFFFLFSLLFYITTPGTIPGLDRFLNELRPRKTSRVQPENELPAKKKKVATLQKTPASAGGLKKEVGGGDFYVEEEAASASSVEELESDTSYEEIYKDQIGFSIKDESWVFSGKPTGALWERNCLPEVREEVKGLIHSYLSVSPNLWWRLYVWFEALNQWYCGGFWMGVGLTQPLVVPSISGYSSLSELLGAIPRMAAQYDLETRYKDPNHPAWKDVKPVPPEPKEQGGDLQSLHWYNIDPHNSHLSVLYRFGLVGFLGYLGLVLGSLIFFLLKIFKRTPGALVFFSISLVYAISSCFNVVLEGPFMGVVFWTLTGAGVGFFFCNRGGKA